MITIIAIVAPSLPPQGLQDCCVTGSANDGHNNSRCLYRWHLYDADHHHPGMWPNIGERGPQSWGNLALSCSIVCFRAPSPRQVFPQPQGPASFALWCGGVGAFGLKFLGLRIQEIPKGIGGLQIMWEPSILPERRCP